MADTDPLGPFGATVQGVIDLLPHATFPETLNPGQKGVSKAMVAGYVMELSGRVDLKLVDRDRLTGEGRVVQVEAAARDAIHNGAASYAQAARFPEQSAPNSDGYAGVLWARFETAVKDVAGLVDAWLVDSDDATPEEGTSPGYSFPCAQATETMLF